MARCPQSSTPPPLPSRRQRPRTCGSQGPRRRAPSPPQKLPRRPRARARAVSKRYMIIVARGGILRRQSPAQSCEGRQSASRGQHGRCARVCKACTVCVKPCTQNCTDHCSLLKAQYLSRTGGVPSRHRFVPRRSKIRRRSRSYRTRLSAAWRWPARSQKCQTPSALPFPDHWSTGSTWVSSSAT